MSEQEELKAILGIMLIERYPDRSKNIIRSLRIISRDIREIIEEQFKQSITNEKDTMNQIAQSLVFLALNVNADY